jgi:hypothetical protein
VIGEITFFGGSDNENQYKPWVPKNSKISFGSCHISNWSAVLIEASPRLSQAYRIR